MSGVNISYEIATGGGQIRYYSNNSLSSNESSNVANVIAGEIVNEILENALDIATRVSDTGLHWKEIRESRSLHRATMNQSHVNQIESQNPKQNPNEPNRENVCSNIVGDIMENVGIPSAQDICSLIDDLNSISANEQIEVEKGGAESIDVEMKKLLAEMMSCPCAGANHDNLPINRGVGDQPSTISETATNEIIAQPEVPRTVEKKSRVTDLVKNSPRIISQYLLMDEAAKQNQEEWEESTEQILQVIELDHVKVGEVPFKVQKSVYPEKIALPTDDEEDDLVEMPSDDCMDIIDLTSNAVRRDEMRLTSAPENSTGAMGDDRKSDNMVNVNRPYDTATSGGEAMESIAMNQKQLFGTQSNALVEQQKSKKKKCNFGTRIWGFLKKGHKTNEQGSSTSS